MATLMPFVWVLVMIGFVGATYFYRQRMMGAAAATEQQHTEARAGAVAQRMGLALVQGDPNFNFYYTNRWQDLGQAMSRNVLSRPSRPDIELRMEGTPGGRRVELVYVDRLRVEDNLLSRDVMRWLDMRLIVGVQAPFPDFEVTLRTPNEYMRPEPQLALPPASFGDPMLDTVLALKTNDPRIAPAIAEGMRLFAGEHYVHVIGARGVLTFRCTDMSAMAFGHGDKLLLAMDAAARGIEQAAAQHLAARA
ncbi:MAG: hypothetical protein U0234_21025 [Sandaracinus sp.]